jgi:predicted nucleic acid-binding protein
MKIVFVDTFYWVALLNRKDPWNATVVERSPGLQARRFVTTNEVLGEVLALFSAAGPHAPQRVARFVRGLFDDPTVSGLIHPPKPRRGVGP